MVCIRLLKFTCVSGRPCDLLIRDTGGTRVRCAFRRADEEVGFLRGEASVAQLSGACAEESRSKVAASVHTVPRTVQ